MILVVSPLTLAAVQDDELCAIFIFSGVTVSEVSLLSLVSAQFPKTIIFVIVS